MLSQLDMSHDDRDPDSVQDNFNPTHYPDSSTSCPSPPPSPLPDSLGTVHLSSHLSQKPLKDKSRIDLAPNQPPTTQGRPRVRVFVACLQWYAPSPHSIDVLPYSSAFASRRRKIRCDGTKPKCYHCSQREGNEECIYDTPKRRGPDKSQRSRTRGTRQETDGRPTPRRRRRHPTDSKASASGILQSRDTANPWVLDTSEDSTLFPHPQQNDACVHTLDPVFELLESRATFGRTISHNQMLTFDSISTGDDVSRHFLSG
jgi:Zn(2)-Cys(6) binuclear cluster domain-containing protein